MSDHDAANEPIDRAYGQAEALLDDAAARAARRARVLAAVAQEPAPAAVDGPARRRSPWRRGGWLAAASVAVFCAFLAGRIYQPARYRPAPLPAPAAPTQPRSAPSASPEPTPPSRAAQPEPPSAAASRPAPPRAPRLESQTSAAAPRTQDQPSTEAYAPAPALVPAPAPAPPPPPLAVAPQSSVNEVVVTGARIGRRDAAAPRAALAMKSAAVMPGSAEEQAASLRAAAAQGRTREMETLLAQGVPVDAADAAGTTALMKSIQADRPTAAALLRRHGASLEQRNRSGLSARDMAAAKDDPDLDQALDLTLGGDSGERSRIGSQ